MKKEQFSTESIGKAFIPKPFRHRLQGYLLKAGVEDVPYKIYGMVFYVITVLTGIAYLVPIFPSATGPNESMFDIISQHALFGVFVFTFLFWVGLMLVLTVVFMVIYKVVYDLRIFQRRLQIEEVLPDFLQLTAANIRAGMTIDRALWFAVRPRFGVLAKEIELVAKETLSGRDLEASLVEFSKKYDSATTERSINLLLSGLRAGGEVGDLLNKISMNIQEMKTMKKEMAANVMTYVIFITFATVLAAPFLFALSYNLLIIIQRIMGTINLPKESMGAGGFGNLLSNMSSDAVSVPAYHTFCILMLIVSSFFSACIIASIQKGSIKEGFRYIPIFIASTLGLFLLASWGLGYFLQSMV